MKEERVLKKLLSSLFVIFVLITNSVSVFAGDVYWNNPDVPGSEAGEIVDPRIKKFPDIPEDHFAKKSIEYCSMRLMQGKEDGNFHPDALLKRAEAVQILRNSLPNIEIETNAIFSDVKPGAWYYEALSFATQEKLCGGFPDGTFRPQEELTYEQFAVMIYNYMKRKYPLWFTKNTYSEGLPKYAKYSNYSKQALLFIEYLVKPENAEQKDATQPITRAEAAIFAHRADNMELLVWQGFK